MGFWALVWAVLSVLFVLHHLRPRTLTPGHQGPAPQDLPVLGLIFLHATGSCLGWGKRRWKVTAYVRIISILFLV